MFRWSSAFLFLVFFLCTCSASYRCQNSTSSWEENVQKGLHDVQDYLFSRSLDVNGTASCDLSHNKYNAVYCIVFAAFVFLGVVFTFLGYRLFKFILFATGFISVFIFVYYVAYNNIPCSWTFKYLDVIAFGIAVASGLIVGILAVCLFYFGMVVVGFALGCVAALAFLSFAHISYIEDHSWLPIVIILALGIVGVVVTLIIQKPLIILSTSVVGGYLIVMGLDYFVENMQAFIYAWNLLDRRTKPTFPNCPATWVMLCTWPVLALVGLIIQGKFTGKGDRHSRKKKHRANDIEMDGHYTGRERLLFE